MGGLTREMLGKMLREKLGGELGRTEELLLAFC